LNAADITTRKLVTAWRDTSVSAAARLPKRGPVVKDGKRSGAISHADLLDALGQRPTIRPSD
jgi:CBS domain-containing protein